MDAASRGPVASPRDSAWSGLTASRNLVLQGNTYQFASVDVHGHSITAYGTLPDASPDKAIVITWGLSGGLTYATRRVSVPDATCDGIFSAAGNTLALRINRGFDHSDTGLWVVPLSAPGELTVPENPVALRLTEKPILRYYVSGKGDRVAVIEARSEQERTRYDFKEIEVDPHGRGSRVVRFEPHFDVDTIELLGYHSTTDQFCVLRSNDPKAKESLLKSRMKGTGAILESADETGGA